MYSLCQGHSISLRGPNLALEDIIIGPPAIGTKLLGVKSKIKNITNINYLSCHLLSGLYPLRKYICFIVEQQNQIMFLHLRLVPSLSLRACISLCVSLSVRLKVIAGECRWRPRMT